MGVNSEKWQRMDVAALWQLIVLAIGLDPDVIHGDSISGEWEPYLPDAEYAGHYRDLMDLAEAALDVDALKAEVHSSPIRFSKIRPAEFVRWMRSKRMSGASQMEALLTPDNGAPTDQESAPDPGVKRVRSLRIMVLGMAVSKYGYIHGVRGDTAVKISQDLQRHGVAISDDAVLRALKDAHESLDPKDRPKKSS